MNKLVQAYRHTGIEQNYKLTATTGNLTTSLQPHRRHTKQQACRHTGYKPTSFPPRRQQKYKLAATQAY